MRARLLMIWILALCLLVTGCLAAPDTPTETVLPTETVCQEVLIDGCVYASEDKVYDFPDDRPVFSLEGGLYSYSILVELKTAEPATIYYTTDGTDPDTSSTLYDPDTGIRITRQTRDFPTAYTIRARAYYADGRVSDVAAHTYFSAKDLDARFTTVVVSISGDTAELTDGPDGIFYGDNAYDRGDDTEREVFVTAWDANGTELFSQFCGLRIYGGASRGNSIKSMKLYARKSYDADGGKFNTDIFGTLVQDGSGDVVDEYDKLVLRNTGNDFQFSFIRDELCQRLAMQAGFTDYEAVTPAVVYLNGSYYGLFWLHESYCDDYFKAKYPNDDAQGEFVVIEGTEQWKSEDEDKGKEVYAQEYNEDYSYFSQADLTDETVYSQLRQWMDVENYLDYFAFNVYINNWDWPQNNYKCYRYVCAEDEEAGEGVYDGRWRYLLHDTDFSFWLYESDEVAADYDNIRQILNPSSDRYAPLLDALMHRADCREYFLAKLTELAEGALSGQNVTRTLYAMHVERCTEMDYMYQHMEALRDAGDTSFWTSSYTMAANMDNIRAFANARAEWILRYTEKVLLKYQ